MRAIETSGLTRAFAKAEAVRQLALRVPIGSVFALIGPNGAGKTTTIKMLMNLLEPTTGDAMMLGVNSRRLGVSELQRIGYVSENQQLPEWMSPAQLLEYCRPFYPTWDDGFAARLQKSLGLTAAAPLRHLSRGTRMKAALLSSLAYRPELIVLDEPFSGLDPLVREELATALLAAAADRGSTVFISSHDIDEVERLADWIGFMVEGRLIFSEPVDALLTRFRLVEVIRPEGAALVPSWPETWLPLGKSGRTTRFIDTRHDAAAHEQVAGAFRGAAITVTAMPLRDIFITLARGRAHQEAV